jgi:hypothetical protein
VSDGREAIYDAFAARFEPADELLPTPHLRLDTEQLLTTTLARVSAELG